MLQAHSNFELVAYGRPSVAAAAAGLSVVDGAPQELPCRHWLVAKRNLLLRLKLKMLALAKYVKA